MLTVQSVRDLRNKTKIGDHIKFYIRRKDFEGFVEGKVANKFDHVFLMTDGRTYSWKEYLLGKGRTIYDSIYEGLSEL